MKHKRELSFRKDIEGLRAIAVIAVILYHFELGLPGGFTGVDVFFVISGYLILRIVLNKLWAGEFSLADFYSRRIKRILPLSLTVICATTLGALLLMPTEAFHLYYASAKAALLMYSNLYFSHVYATNYFVDSAEWQPLLHTWSLAVEEQFYIVIPVFLLVLSRLSKRALTIGILSISLGSLYLCLSIPAETAFFAPWARAWELCCGGLIACWELSGGRAKGASFRNILAVFGLLGFGYSFFALTSSLSYPSYWALIPVLSTCAILIAHQNSSTFLSEYLLEHQWMQVVGKLSYSLYLWHWPMFVLSRYIITKHTLPVKIVLLLGTVILSKLSFHFIENPFRHSTKLNNLKYTYGFLVIGIAGALIFLKFSVYCQEKVEEFVEQNYMLGPSVESIPAADSQRVLPVSEMKDRKVFPSGHYDYVVLGDSHVNVQKETIALAAKEMKLKGLLLWQAGYIPVPGVWNPKYKWMMSFEESMRATDNIIEAIIENKISNVILIDRWRSKISDELPLAIKNKANFSSKALASDSITPSIDGEYSSNLLKNNLEALILKLKAKGIRVWVLQQVPTLTEDPSGMARNFYRFPSLNEVPKLSVHEEESLKDLNESRLLINALKNKGAMVLDPFPYFFDGGEFEAFSSEGAAFYKDLHHLTPMGAYKYLIPMWEQVFSIIQKDKLSEKKK